ncbi:J domain-containing protein [Anabaenopsis elenkinii]|jgi:hypothetical protein|uniref:DnaJ domain-containing protein n=1 Tax=Anabaenopsis elenkinii CCIBt3563 TaxID=2779889 RepID=A0A7S6TYX8_9CYAN|nr:J domain-containing protein [Anabaenopsis elenkinii]QOV22035.1 DnaJ domain-containing protein [Anabaenopsis elenkinii CCIBt3563]
MDLEKCYKLLGLKSGASLADIKASYRRLAQQYHPDVNPHDITTQDKFIVLTKAYKFLVTVVSAEDISPPSSNASKSGRNHIKSRPAQKPPTSSVRLEKPPRGKPPNIAEIEQRLKWKTYEQIQRFLKEKRFTQAIALVEALAARLPTDKEVRQWQAVAYQIWGRVLMSQNQLLKARIYLKKALNTDHNNQTLWREVLLDFQKLEQLCF